MEKILLIGNGFTSQLIPEYQNNTMMQRIQAEVPGLYEKANQLFAPFRKKVDSVQRTAIAWGYSGTFFSGGSPLYHPISDRPYNGELLTHIEAELKKYGFDVQPISTDFFQTYGLIYETQHDNISNVESLLKVISLFGCLGEFTREDRVPHRHLRPGEAEEVADGKLRTLHFFKGRGGLKHPHSEEQHQQAVANALHGVADALDDRPYAAALERVRGLREQRPQLGQLVVPAHQRRFNVAYKYADFSGIESIKVFSDADDAKYTFEVVLYYTNQALCDKLFGDGALEYMLNNKTEAAYQLLSREGGVDIQVPEYIQEAIKWIRE